MSGVAIAGLILPRRVIYFLASRSPYDATGVVFNTDGAGVAFGVVPSVIIVAKFYRVEPLIAEKHIDAACIVLTHRYAPSCRSSRICREVVNLCIFCTSCRGGIGEEGEKGFGCFKDLDIIILRGPRVGETQEIARQFG